MFDSTLLSTSTMGYLDHHLRAVVNVLPPPQNFGDKIVFQKTDRTPTCLQYDA